MKLKMALFTTMILLLLASPTYAALQSFTVTTPTSGQTFYPNLNDDYILASFSFRDDVNAPIHKVTIKINDGDSNSAFAPADTNLSSNNCTVTSVYNGVTYTCVLRYNFPTTNVLPTQNYKLDFNVTAYDADGDFNATTGAIVPFSVDNKYTDAATLAVIGLITLVLAGLILFTVLRVLDGSMTPQEMLAIVGIAIVVVLVIIVASEMILSFTP